MNSLRHISFLANKPFTAPYKISVRKPLFPVALIMAKEFSTGSLKVEHEEKNNRFVVKLGQDIAFLSYNEDPPGVFDLEHTWVPTSLRGKGIAEILATEAFDYIVKHNKKMILTCSYLINFEKKVSKQEYKDHIVSR